MHIIIGYMYMNTSLYVAKIQQFQAGGSTISPLHDAFAEILHVHLKSYCNKGILKQLPKPFIFNKNITNFIHLQSGLHVELNLVMLLMTTYNRWTA